MLCMRRVCGWIEEWKSEQTYIGARDQTPKSQDLKDLTLNPNLLTQ